MAGMERRFLTRLVLSVGMALSIGRCGGTPDPDAASEGGGSGGEGGQAGSGGRSSDDGDLDGGLDGSGGAESSDPDTGTIDTGAVDAGICEEVVLHSTVRSRADWGWTDGPGDWTGYRVSTAVAESYGFVIDCSRSNIGLREPTGPGRWIVATVQGSGNDLKADCATDTTDREYPWEVPLARFSGCGFVSFWSRWNADVFDADTGCPVGWAMTSDTNEVIPQCEGAPIVTGAFPPVCPDEVIEQWCPESDEDAGT